MGKGCRPRPIPNLEQFHSNWDLVFGKNGKPSANQVTMTTDEWQAKYKPIQNHFDENASWGGIMFETYGEEYDYVISVNEKSPDRVWTIVDDGDKSWVTSGWHYVNRLGYVITELPADATFIDAYDPDEGAQDDEL